MKPYDVIIIGAGQSGLACAYFLRRLELGYLILEKQEKSGGAWNYTWDSLTLFSPAEHSSLPGWQMPKSNNVFPKKNEVIHYLEQYVSRYQFPIQYQTNVLHVSKENGLFKITNEKGELLSKVVIAASGNWNTPFIPIVKGMERFSGIQVHSAYYKNAEPFSGKKVLIVGEGNSGAQLLAEISKVAETKWSTKKTPTFLPDDMDGFDLFTYHSQRALEKDADPTKENKLDLGNIVMVPAVKEARERGVLKSYGNIAEITENGVIWENGTNKNFDVIIWCTGFNANTSFLSELVDLDEKGRTATDETMSIEVEGLYLVGYGSWTGLDSATLVGVGRTARKTAELIKEYLGRSL